MAGKTDYKRQFNAQNYDRIEITVKKGQKESIKQHAESKGESLNKFINRAIGETIKNDKNEPNNKKEQE